MVTRKPVPIVASAATQQASSKTVPPYPISPTLDSAKTTASGTDIYSPNLSSSPAFDLIDMREARQRTRSDSDVSSHGTWDSDDEEDARHGGAVNGAEVPKPLNIRSTSPGDAKKEQLPAILRPGMPQESQPQKSGEASFYQEESQGNPWAELSKSEQPPPITPASSNNPYLVRQHSGVENSQSAWQESLPTRPPPMPNAAPPPPPPPQPQSSFADNVPLDGAGEEDPWRVPPLDHRPASWETAERLSVPQIGQSPLPPVTDYAQASRPAVSRPLSRWWDSPGTSHQEEGTSAFGSLSDPPTNVPPSIPEVVEYHDLPGPPPERPPVQSESLLDRQDNYTRPAPTIAIPPTQSRVPESSGSEAVPETPRTQLRQQRNEHYQIKHVNWYDDSRTSNPRSQAGMRSSPILTQNANGPCPLLALVNALVLSTPHDTETALLETLRTREQVSLGLLLDAVFDELMSGRRNDTSRGLPDVSELYSFLLALHTGMNVNPRFVTPATTPRGSFDGHPAGIGKIHPLHRAQSKVGAFEETREMRLYSTFNIPLIHGWTPSVDSPAYEAFMRSAQTFEDAQNIQFTELELNDKSGTTGLSPQEQQTLQDIQIIKAFLQTWPTQLTDFGLDTISQSLQPGQIAILFRNDHFSTIYKEPRHGALMTLVTDAGYESHEEIVWESLVDVNGSASELFSGDFRIVSHGSDARLNQGNSAGGEEGWETVQSRSPNRGNQQSDRRRTSGEPTPPPLPGPRPLQTISLPTEPDDLRGSPQTDAERRAAEQEDHDLALALQLQEEEEDRHRQDEERRRREQELSEQFLSNEAEGPRPQIPPRRSRNRNSSSANIPSTNRPVPANPSTPTGRPPVSRRTDASDPDAPPTYEQAASDRPYRPGDPTTPVSPRQGNALGAYDVLRQQQQQQQQQQAQQAASALSSAMNNADYTSQRRSDANRIRRVSQQSALPGVSDPDPRVRQAAGVRDAEDRCVVM